MKTIMFNDKYGLTAAVLSGRKTQTRRNIPREFSKLHIDIRDSWFVARYKIGEVVSIAQAYKDIATSDGTHGYYKIGERHYLQYELSGAGWNNKMFVKADLMPHHIYITDVRVERLQDISDEDCLKEGIEWLPDGARLKPYAFYDTTIHIKNDKEEGYGWYVDFDTPREAYAALIDRLNGKGTWASNPIVWVYDFELVD